MPCMHILIVCKSKNRTWLLLLRQLVGLRCGFFSSSMLRLMLKDKSRVGAPLTYTPEQQCVIVGLAVCSPEEFGLPTNYWIHRESAGSVFPFDESLDDSCFCI